MEIKRSGSQLSNKGPAEWFTGIVRIQHSNWAKNFTEEANENYRPMSQRIESGVM